MTLKSEFRITSKERFLTAKKRPYFESIGHIIQYTKHYYLPLVFSDAILQYGEASEAADLIGGGFISVKK
jgi:hypothetical protein